MGGIDDHVQEVLELVVMPMKHPELYSRTGVPPPRLPLIVLILISGESSCMVLRGVEKHYLQMRWQGFANSRQALNIGTGTTLYFTFSTNDSIWNVW
jgi:hypothetical protein